MVVQLVITRLDRVIQRIQLCYICRHTGAGRYPEKYNCGVENPTFILLKSMNLYTLAHDLVDGVLGRKPSIFAEQI